ncbi:MAG: glycosyl transferase [Desulfobacteraceae bacterium]|nr:glycosyl transferase [Desulfobacteraceae bacterium]
MKILVYCQNVWGVGHVFRTLEICRALGDHEVVLIMGGRPLDTLLPPNVRCLRLPALEMNADYSAMLTVAPEMDIEEIKAKRAKELMEIYRREAPDVLFIELFPFGRNAFRFELEPVLKTVLETKGPKPRVICSVRDILVEKKDVEHFEARVVRTLNRYFDGVLIHGDKSLISLDETFTRMEDIRIPVVYTGYVTPRPDDGAGQRIRDRKGLGPGDTWMVASAGGGRVAAALMQAVADAFDLLVARNGNIHLHMFTGPYMPEAEFRLLKRRSGPRLRVARFTDAFPEVLAGADLSISMGGYNTCMNVLAVGVRALMVPSGQDREQGMRLKRLAARGAVHVLTESKLSGEAMAEAVRRALSGPPPGTDVVDLNGAAASAAWIERWVQDEPGMRK